jgi:hypothetical protein
MTQSYRKIIEGITNRLGNHILIRQTVLHRNPDTASAMGP